MKYFTALCATLTLALPATAQDLDQVASVDVLPGWTTADGDQMAALRITLAPGWKTYWRAPGDVGIPPMANYNRSENLSTVRMQWPTPQVFHDHNMRSIGYYGSVVLPVELERASEGDIRLSGTLSIGVCEDICVPVHLDFDAILPTGGRRDPVIIGALVDRPLRADEAGVTDVSCALSPTEHGISIEVAMTLPPTGGTEHVVIEAGDPHLWISEPSVVRSGNTLTATAQMAHYNGDAFAVDRSGLRFTVLGDTAVDIRGCTSDS